MLNLLFLLIAIILETNGDAAVRVGLRLGRPTYFIGGALLVIAYSIMISLPNWSFGRTMGVYIAMFFIISQIVARVMMHETLRLPTVVGGVLIVSGGLVILFWKPA